MNLLDIDATRWPHWRSDDGNVLLINADCLEVLPVLPGEIVIVSDPPYGINYKHSGHGAKATGRTALRRFTEAITGDAVEFDPRPMLRWKCLLFGADHYCSMLPSGGAMHVWDKAYSGGPKDSFSDAELFWTSWLCSREVVRYLWKGVCQDGEKGVRKFHQSQKPIAVMLACVSMTNGDCVLDPYLGSGSTGVACVRLGRQFIGIELEPRYYEIAIKRIKAEIERFPLFEKTAAKERTLFDEVTE